MFDFGEYKAALKRLGHDDSAEETLRLLKRYDADHNKALDLREFAGLVADLKVEAERAARRREELREHEQAAAAAAARRALRTWRSTRSSSSCRASGPTSTCPG